MPTAKPKTTQTATQRSAAAAPSTATGTAANTQPEPEEKVAQEVVKLLTQASEVLTKTISDSASLTAKARLQAQKKAHTLLTKAHRFLGQTIDKLG